MKFKIRDIGSNGREVSRHLDHQCVQAMLAPVGVELATDEAEAKLELRLSLIESAVLVDGAVQGGFSVTCGRCLGPALIRVEERDLHVTFLKAPESHESDIEIEDVDTFTHDGEELDLEPFVRELMVMSIPMAPLCDPECKGICTACGQNRNQEACACNDQLLDLTPLGRELQRLKKQHT